MSVYSKVCLQMQDELCTVKFTLCLMEVSQENMDIYLLVFTWPKTAKLKHLEVFFFNVFHQYG